MTTVYIRKSQEVGLTRKKETTFGLKFLLRPAGFFVDKQEKHLVESQLHKTYPEADVKFRLAGLKQAVFFLGWLGSISAEF